MNGVPEENIEYVDIPTIFETFADTMKLLTFDGQIFKIEFCVTRLDDPTSPEAKAANKITAKRYPTSRLVLHPQAVLTLYNQLAIAIKQLEATGAIIKTEQAQESKH